QYAQGTPVPCCRGTVHSASRDTTNGVVLPPDSTLVNGQGSFSATLIRAGSQTITVADAANHLSSSARLTIIAAPASQLALTGAPSTAAAGSSLPFTVTAREPSGNTASTYARTVPFRSTHTS